MSDLSGDQKCGIAAMICITISIAVVAWAIAWYNTRTWSVLVEGGYEQRTVEGHSSPVWVKTDKTKKLAEEK